MSIGNIQRYNIQGKVVEGIGKTPSISEEIKGESKTSSFQKTFSDAIRQLDTLEKDSNNKIEAIYTGSEPVNSHDAMMALQKADVAFQLMNRVRQKVVRAYEEMMRTPV